MHRCSWCAVVVALVSTVALAEDVKVPPFIKPYPGSQPYSTQTVRDFDEITLITGKINESKGSGLQRFQGKVTQLAYDMPEGRSTLEVFKNYEQALLDAGFQKVFSCSGPNECGDGISPMPGWSGPVNQFVNAQARYMTAKLPRSEGTLWVGLYVTPIGLPLTKVIIVEEKPMDTGMVKVDVAALKGALERDGHIAVYGIVFDTGKATLKPESSAALDEVKKLLDQEPALKLYVVGHTDDVGDPSANMQLSNQRAAAVVKELTTRYKVAGNRLKAQGVGPYVPVATNRNEAGRAKNRRVELVEAMH